ncbi:MAG: glutaredoxin [Methanobacteriota archaeon]|nr:MAG: glutaredoxin [Euryarchaeota archaeon]|tara:strand:+ start:50 stop:325 length:276 start_codon:yes stop_codon:yes gene_type:complete
MSEVILKDIIDLNSDFLIYSSDFCPYCVAAERYLRGKGLSFTIIDLTNDPQKRFEIVKATNHRTVPVIFDLRNGKPEFIGGFDDLQASELV